MSQVSVLISTPSCFRITAGISYNAAHYSHLQHNESENKALLPGREISTADRELSQQCFASLFSYVMAMGVDS